MNSKWRTKAADWILLHTSPFWIVATITLAKVVLFFLILPLLPESISKFYGIGFTDDYDRLALNLSEGNGYRFSPDTALTLAREPGYPLVLSVLFGLFGYGLTPARIANLVFGVMSALLITRLARNVSGDALVSRLAPVAFLIHPGVVVAELRGGVESLFIFLLMCFFVLLYKATQSKRMLDYLWAGLMLGLVSSVRSTALLFPFFLFFYFFLWEKSPRPPFSTMFGRVAVVMAGAFMVLMPWTIRNYLLVEKIIPTASVQGTAVHAGNYICEHLSFSNGMRDADWQAALVRTDLARSHGYRFKDEGTYYLYFYDVRDEVTFNQMLGQEVFKKYLDSPIQMLKCASKNAFNFWFSGKNWTSTALNFLVQLPYIVLAVGGVILGLRSERSSQVGILLLFVIYTLGTYLPIHSQVRYSIPLVPILSILGALYLARCIRPQEEIPISSV